MTELKNRIQNILTGKSVPLKEVLTLLQQDVAYAEDERKHYENQLKEYDKKVDVLKKELHRLEAIIDNFVIFEQEKMSPPKRKASTQNKNAKRTRRQTQETDSSMEFSEQVDADTQLEAEIESEAEVGIIEEIKLKNFMCHTRLDFKFGSNVNFIVGRNGSGKSAILTGLVVGLGGKANATSRGTTIKSFIKNGKNFAEISITLRNRGTDAYKPAEYGEKIVVNRRLYGDGTSAYSLLSSDGKTISKKREELTHILDQFNIQVDNPVSILNQEISRNFLHSKGPHDKYKFFLKATQLEQMDRDYNSADHDKRLAKELMETKQQALPQIEKEVNNWRKKYKVLESMGKLRERLDEVKNEAVWAQVTELENERENQMKCCTKEERRRPKYLAAVEDSKKKVAEKKKVYKDAQEKLTLITTSLDDLGPQREEKKNLLDTEKQALRKLQLDFQQVKSEIKALESDKQSLVNRIEDIRNATVHHDVQQERQKRMEEIAKKTEKREDLDAKKATTNHHLKQLHSAVIKYQGDIDLNIQQSHQIKTQIDKSTRELRNLEGSKGNQVLKFGRWVPELTRKIETAYKNRQFKCKPYGPIGAFITIKEPKWALAVEMAVGNSLRSFIVDNHNDLHLLEKLMKECKLDRTPEITVTRYTNKLHDVSNNRPRTDRFPTILDMLDVKEVMVANFLIDRSKIETVLLIENNGEAREVMSKRPPEKCTICYTVEGDKVFPFPYYRYYAAKGNRRAQYLQGSTDELMRNIEEDITDLRGQLQDCEKVMQTTRVELDANKKEMLKNEIHYKGLQQMINRLQTEILELNNVDEPDPVDVTTLEQEVTICEESLARHQEKFDELRAYLTEKKQIVDELERNMTELNNRIQNILTGKSVPLKEVLTHSQQDVAYAEDERKHYEKLLKDQDKKVEDLKNELHKLEAIIETNTEKATRVCPRIETTRDPESIDNEIEQINIQLQSEEESHGSKEEVTRQYYEAKKKYETSLAELLKNRRENYAEFRRNIAWRINFLFIMSLKQRNYNGKIDFDHARELLSIKSQPLQDIAEMNEDIRSLSGGERSFSTISFILAIWDAMEAPFRILDEFDVFMDMVTRRVSLNMLLESAVSKTTCQYCFLTPLEIPSHEKEKFDLNRIKVFKMPDPDRTQTRFTTTQQSTWDDEENAQ
uniref:Structural maintenance of chromosomes protein 6 n=1 Tax=Strigamia maritima TaxID=126957 RepID=T1J0A2_STRMM